MKKKSIKTTTLAFDALSAAQWQDLAAIEVESHFTAWSLESLQSSADARHTATALLIDNQVAGYSIFMHNIDDWELLNITIALELHGLGLGKALLAQGLQAATHASCNSVFLEVRRSNVAAIALYSSSGFVQVGVRKGYYRTDKNDVQEDAIILRCDLASVVTQRS